jgi:hypothetical protein
MSILSFFDKEAIVARRVSTGLRVVQVVLAAMLLGTTVLAVVWVGGSNGLGLIDGPALSRVGLDMQENNAVPSESVVLPNEYGVATAAAGNGYTGGINGTLTEHDASQSPDGIGPGDGTSEFYGQEAHLSFWALTRTQHASWVAVRVAPLIGLILIWAVLLLLVRDIGRGGGFTTRTARRLTGIGLLLAIGLPVVQLARWLVARWLVESSTAAPIANAADLRISLWPVAVGLVLVVVAVAWREAARMREDLAGLV